MKKILLIIALSIVSSNFIQAQTNTVVLKTDFEGQVEYGSIESLIAKIQEGKELRIGWHLDFDKDGKSDLTHWIDADFISVLNGHVFNQIAPIYRQLPKKDIPQVEIINSSMQWTGIIGTNGKLISRYIIPDLHILEAQTEDELLKAQLAKQTEVNERIVATVWVIKE